MSRAVAFSALQAPDEHAAKRWLSDITESARVADDPLQMLPNLFAMIKRAKAGVLSSADQARSQVANCSK